MRPDDLAGYRQCHFFAGIGVWSHALRLADWPDDRPVWTGSCPCQPFSAAGARKGSDDHRHLWPEFARLIGERRPSVVFGEQVASKDGRAWLHAVRSDLEGMGYAVGAADLCAAGVGAPHIRQRLHWWPTATASDGNRFPAADFAPTPNMTLNHAAALAGWTTPKTRTGSDTAGILFRWRTDRRGSINCQGGRTLRVADSAKCGCREERPHPGWVAPGDRPQRVPAGPRTSGGNHGSARLSDSGVPLTGSGAATSGGGPLNPEHSRWLQGLPPEWASCAPTEMPSSRKSRQNSSVRQPRP